MKNSSTDKNQNRLIPLFACLILFIGIGRMLSLVTHNPVLAYANNYDMIRLQACHQIWPADKFIEITQGTPTTPLRRYTLEKHVETPCFPSSELIFTGLAIEIAKIKNIATTEELISIKTVGFVKAAFLAVTAIFFSVYLYRRELYTPLLANSLAMLLVLSDPGVTLYMNTFYTEFSALYFLYLSLIGVVVLANGKWQAACSVVLLLGLAGFGFSKPQYISAAIFIGAILAIYVAAFEKKWVTAICLVLFAAAPCLSVSTGIFVPQNESMIQANKINTAGSLLGISNNPEQLLTNLGLPDSCKLLAGKNAYDADIRQKNICPELASVSSLSFKLALIKDPALLARLVIRATKQPQNWIIDSYGQVEHGRTEAVSHYQWTISNVIRLVPDNIFPWLALVTTIIPLVWLIFSYRTHKSIAAPTYLCLLVLLQWLVLGIAITDSGLVGLGKNMHLYLPLVLAEWLILIVGLHPASRFTLGHTSSRLG